MSISFCQACFYCHLPNMSHRLIDCLLPIYPLWPLLYRLQMQHDNLNPSQARLFLPFKGPRGSLGTPLMISGTIKASPMKLCTVIVLLGAYQNTKRNFQNMTYDVTMTSLLKTMAKFRPPQNQVNYISFERKWWELSENVICIEIESLNQKLWSFK